MQNLYRIDNFNITKRIDLKKMICNNITKYFSIRSDNRRFIVHVYKFMKEN